MENLRDYRKSASDVAEDPFYQQLKTHLIASTGLSFYEGRDEYLSGLIHQRLSVLDLPDCVSYSELLASAGKGRAELDAIITLLTVGETYFFRDREQFNAIRDIVLPELIDRKRSSKQLRIWSAGCANGAEPYSLAILLGRDLASQTADWQIDILATDINERSLAGAREGRFGEWTLRSTPEEIKRSCFTSDGGMWTIHPEFKRSISFTNLNLAEYRFSSLQSDTTGLDLILCRNVMIYFAPEMARRLILQFHESLADQGWFVVGAVEHNLDNFKSFRTVDATGTTLYRKIRLQAAHVNLPVEPMRVRPASRSAPVVSFPALRGPDEPDAEGLRRLLDRGEWETAARYSQTLFARDALNPVVHFYHAMLQEQIGLPIEAERSLRQAIYLDRSFAMAHYCLGLTLEKQENPQRAARSFKNVLKILSALSDGETVVAGNTITVADLKQLATTHLNGEGSL